MAGEFDDIRQRLEAISEELADLAIERLKASIDAGGTELPVDERRLTRARRAVEKAAALLRELADFATQERFVYRHKWSVGDLLIWDNRCTMHRATPFDDFAQRRDLRRTTVVGDLPVVASALAA